MRSDEIAHRLKYAAVIALERRQHAKGRLGRPGRLQEAVRSGDTRATAFFAMDGDPAALREVYRTHFPAELAKARRVADAVLGGEVEFFGQTFRIDENINWHADPVSGAEWPRRYHRDVPVHRGNVGFGDVKYVWEVNRHQFLVDLAKIAVLDQSERCAQTVVALVTSWLRAVPYGTGVPWACALEPAFRAWSWLWSYHMLSQAGLLDRPAESTWIGGFHDHGRFLYRHLERFSSPYNHLTGEAAALFALGLSFGEFAEAGAWVRRAHDVLDNGAARQFHADGGSVEQSTFYHHATLGFYLLAEVLGRQHGITFSRQTRDRIERALEFSMALLQPDGRVPRIGGADDGKPIRLEHLPLWDFRPYLAIGAVRHSRGDFKFAAGRFWEDAFWVLGRPGLEAFDRVEPTTPPVASALASSGYYVIRNGWSSTGDYLCFDCGEQAAGLRRDDVPSAAHGHADCLSVVAALGGREVLVDPGFFCYNGSPEWEVGFRKTSAHNTITIDEHDQAQHVSKMAWVRTYAARVTGSDVLGDLGWVSGMHDGYMRLAGGLTHRRTAWLRPDGYIVLYDEIVGGGSHSGEAVLQFAPGELSLCDDGAVFAAEGAAPCEVAWLCSTEVTARIDHAGPSPTSGWMAESLGVRRAAPRLALQFRVDQGRCVLVTILADAARGGTAAPRISVGGGVRKGLLRAVVRGPSHEDEILAAVDGAVATPGVQTDARLVALRRCDGALVDWAQAGGTRISVAAPRRGVMSRPLSVAPVV